jgi:hypothetical protein
MVFDGFLKFIYIYIYIYIVISMSQYIYIYIYINVFTNNFDNVAAKWQNGYERLLAKKMEENFHSLFSYINLLLDLWNRETTTNHSCNSQTQGRESNTQPHWYKLQVLNILPRRPVKQKEEGRKERVEGRAMSQAISHHRGPALRPAYSKCDLW